MSAAVSITGLGIICAIGNDTLSVLESLRSEESGVGHLKYLDTVHRDIPAGEVKLSTEEMKKMLGVHTDAPLSRTSALGAIAVREAVRNSGANLEGKRVALISGTTVGVMDITEKYYERMKTDPSLQSLPHSNECGKSTLEIAELSGLGGVECCTICTACSSALNSIMLGAEMLRRGEADLVIAGGSEPLSRYHFNGFNTLMILDRERCRPFDDTRDGLNLGEGAAFVVLEKDAPNSLAYVTGYANRCDAFHQTASSENGDGAFLSMSAALQMAGLLPSDIQYINAHGTGTPNNDLSESRAIRRVFGENIPEVSSTKAFTGHTTSASGSIETVICVLAMLNGFTPASLGFSNPIPGGILPTPGHSPVQLDNVLCNSFAFGGNDSSLVISRHPSALPPRDPGAFKAREVSRRRVDSIEGLAPIREFLSPMETRRMGKLMKAGLLSAFKALQEAGIECPDAIVTGTSRGMLEFSTCFLDEIVANGEEMLKPTLFMQSTHNTIASAIAIRLGCHGYNITFSQGEESAAWALRDARRLIESGQARNVLVCDFDENVEGTATTSFHAQSIVLIRDE